MGIPLKLLHEAAGHIVTVELKSGELYRGSMIECEDNWNRQLENITFTAKCGRLVRRASLITCVKLFTVMYEDTIFDTKGVIKMQYADGKVAGVAI